MYNNETFLLHTRFCLCSVLAQSIKSFYFCFLHFPENKELPGCREEKTKRFNKYPVVVRACVPACIRAHVRMVATGALQTQGHGLLKRFTAKMPLCNCLIFNEIKYFLKFFLHLKKIAVTLQQKH